MLTENLRKKLPKEPGSELSFAEKVKNLFHMEDAITLLFLIGAVLIEIFTNKISVGYYFVFSLHLVRIIIQNIFRQYNPKKK